MIPDCGEGRRVEAWWGGRFWRAKTLRRHVDGGTGDEYYLVRWGDDTWMATVRLLWHMSQFLIEICFNHSFLLFSPSPSGFALAPTQRCARWPFAHIGRHTLQ